MEKQYGGYMGSFLDINLTNRKISTYEIPTKDREMYLGGKALAAKLLMDNLPAGIDPLSPDNIMVLTTGPLCGTGAPCSSRFNLSTKGVLTGGISSSNSGGTFGMYLKRAGYDGILFRGRAEEPVWIRITETEVAIQDAGHLWGLDTEETQKKLPRHAGKLVIGPAGENLVRYAAILCGERALGRGGVGAVMGSKNLKAVTAWGSKRPPIHNKEGFSKRLKQWVRLLKAHPITGRHLPRYGTAGNTNACNATFTLPHRNFQYGQSEHSDTVSGERMAAEILTRNTGCTSCPIRCARMVKVGKKEVKGPEFETVGMFGPNMENWSIQKIADWNYLIDKLGFDTITAGSTIACAMELAERGLLELPVSFGRFEGMEKLLTDIAYRRGIGEDLAEGSMRLAEKYGAPELAMHAKGMELAAYEPRGAYGHGLGYATANRGGCHLNGGYTVFFEAIGPLTLEPLTAKSKPELVVFNQNLMEAVSSMGNCLFTTYTVVPGGTPKLIPPYSRRAKIVSDLALAAEPLLHLQGKLRGFMLPINVPPVIMHSAILKELTGMPMTLGKFYNCGERGFTLERLFNLREGLAAMDDSLPKRLTEELQRENEPKSRVPLAKMLPRYYGTRDWDKNGVPTLRLLKKLGMQEYGALVSDIDGHPQTYRARRTGLLKSEKDSLGAALKQAGAVRDSLTPERVNEIVHAMRLEKSKSILGHRFRIDPKKCRQCGVCAKKCPVGAITWQMNHAAKIMPEKCIQCGTCFEVCPPRFNAVLKVLDKKLLEQKMAVAYRVDPEKCDSDGICFRKCPVQAISWLKKKPAVINDELCVRCGLCAIVCPDRSKAIDKVPIAAKGDPGAGSIEPG